MDLSLLGHLYAVSGPFATAYVETPSTTEDAAKRTQLGWRGLREQLVELGADDACIAAMDDALTGELHGAGRVLVAAQGRLLLDFVLDDAPRRETVHWGSLPHVMPFVAMLSDAVPYVLVVCDRVGADITVLGDLGRPEERTTVAGETIDITKRAPGGWSQPRYQRRAENTWDANAKDVAREVSQLARDARARVIVCAGDVRAQQLLRDHLDADIVDRFLAIDEGGRAAGASAESLDRRVQQLVAEVAVRDAMLIVDEFAQERGQHDRAVEGMAATVECLRKAQVRTLVLVDDPSSTATLWVGPDATQLALTKRELVDLGVTKPQQDRADAAIVRALVGTAAEICVVPGGNQQVADGVGAVLRYADVSTPA